ncbi:conserved hypothetical protein [Methanococcus vannielii SB]|uniref:Uncharacterized protein n=1 Tax=Methanococcus vannielii (strain ATCC 35089 / DSM 1224 / JCM 13029 / OCM 148 / SB) TaxID=406327 RepID=A6USP6_METVS|nr:hypothetical protein [Methanococcus vannielii]ABR55518.1 conserved hypothetical protein [Methanococcus vannielii SB]
MEDGKCGIHEYSGITEPKIEVMMKTLKEHNIAVSGNNPWVIDPNQHGIKLKAEWDGNSVLRVIVTDKSFYVPCSKIWDEIDPLLKKI